MFLKSCLRREVLSTSFAEEPFVGDDVTVLGIDVLVVDVMIVEGALAVVARHPVSHCRRFLLRK
jgi:hypothetical protein